MWLRSSKEAAQGLTDALLSIPFPGHEHVARSARNNSILKANRLAGVGLPADDCSTINTSLKGNVSPSFAILGGLKLEFDPGCSCRNSSTGLSQLWECRATDDNQMAQNGHS